MKKNTYITPQIEHIILPTEAMMLTATPGVSSQPYNPSIPVGAKPVPFNEDEIAPEPTHYFLWDEAE